jgi:hypothetical protein
MNFFRLVECYEPAGEVEPSGALVIESANGSAVPVSQPLGVEEIRHLGSADAIDAVASARIRLGAG